MDFIVWTERYSVKIEKIDEQHKKFIGIINKLYQGMLDGYEEPVLGVLLEELINYASYHFKTEEKLMLEYDFKGYAEHKIEHEAFKVRIEDFYGEWQHGDKKIIGDLFVFLNEWVDVHIAKTDQKYVDLLTARL